jgi:tetratricopeptide (TPR) repeat protein
LLSLVALVSLAHADKDAVVARDHYKKGTLLYDLRRYREAAREYEAAYEASEDVALLFNIGQAFRLAGDYDQALASYLAFLRRSPRSSNRAEIEARIREMKELIAQQRRTQTSPPDGTLVVPSKNGEQVRTSEPNEKSRQPAPAEPAPPPPAPVIAPAPQPPLVIDRNAGRAKKIAGLTVGAVGIAALAAGTGLAVVATQTSSQVERAVVFDPALDARGRAFEGASIGLLAAGGAALVTGTIVFVLGHRESRAARAPLTASIR